jgi:hypothetical protein
MGPELLHGIGGFIVDKTDVYRDYAKGVANLGNAGGYDSSMLNGMFRPGSGLPTGWMRQTGTSATDAVSNLNKYGIVQRSAQGAHMTAAALAGIPLMQGTSGMDPSTIIAYARMRAGLSDEPNVAMGGSAFGYGIGTDDSGDYKTAGGGSAAGRILGRLDTVLSRAVAQGLDRATVLRSIDANIQYSVRSGGNIVGGQAESFVSSMMSGKSAASRSGTLAADFQAGIGNYLQDPTASPTSMFFSTAMIRKYSTRDALKALNPETYNSIMADPPKRQLLEDHLRLAANPAQDTTWPAVIAMYSAADQATAFESVASGMLGGLDTPIGRARYSTMTNTKPLATAQYVTTRGQRNNNPLNLTYAPGQGTIGRDGRFGRYSTMEEGVAAAERQLLIDQDKYGFRTLASLIGDPDHGWSPAKDGNDVPGILADLKTLSGYGPNDPINMRDPATARKVINAMGRRESGFNDPAVVNRGVAQALGIPESGIPTAAGPATRQKIAMFDNTASGVRNTEALNGQAALSTSEDAFKKLSAVADLSNTASIEFATATRSFATAVDKLVAAVTPIMAGRAGRAYGPGGTPLAEPGNR